ncbi:MAG: DUF1800 domain-containing protein [Jatrophihabitans sp.]|nr:MAG: DUF1800 domain-containing protein [Jatrophihabitans sp.]
MTTTGGAWQAAARLVRRTGFGATGREVDAVLAAGSASYVRSVLAAAPDPAPAPPPVAPLPRAPKDASADQRRAANRQIEGQQAQVTTWWLQRMVTTTTPFAEKLTFCWHDHFATSAQKVRSATWLLQQNQKLRTLGRGDFRTLAMAMLTDAAMLRWLDGVASTGTSPNENLAREFMELFALGHGDGYTEADVRAGAKALTGWVARPDGTTYLVPRRHDDTPQTFLGVHGVDDAASYCDAVLTRPQSPRYLATRWWGQLASGDPPSPALLEALTAAYGPGYDLTAMFTTMLTRPEFAVAEGTLVVGPVEWLVGVLRALQVPVGDAQVARRTVGALRALGQEPFYPPSVGGWPGGQAWLSTAAADLRVRLAAAVAARADLSAITASARGNRLDAVAYLLGIASWSSRSAAALTPEVGSPARLVALAVNTPEYLVH